MKKLWKGIITALLVLPFVAGIFGATTVNAEEVTVPVTLHKVVYEDNYPEGYPIQNTGDVMDEFASAEGLEDVEFTVYDVTEAYHTALSGSNQSSAQAAVIAAYQADPTVFGSGTKLTRTDTGGLTTTNLPKTSNGKDAAYLFIETATPAAVTVTQKAAPIVLAFPVYKYDAATEKFTDTELDAVHLYPKNITAEDTKTVTNLDQFDVITENGSVYKMERGQKIGFQLTLNIPADIADITYSVTDTPTDGLAFVASSLEIAQLADDSYTVTPNATTGGFKLELDSTKADVQALAGGTLTITYQMELTKDLVPDTVEGNKANVTIGDTTQPDITPNETFKTGGKKIVKTDKHTDKTLAGAEFVVKNGEKFGEFELNSKNEYVLIGWVNTQTAATKITSLADGSLNVIGLKYGEYVLNETKAPSEEYVKIPDGTYVFSVVEGEYATEALLDVPNTPKGLLPSTGGNGIYAFLLVGAALMIGAYAWFRKSKTQAEV